MHERPVQEVTNEELIATGDRGSDITEGEGSTVRFSVRELVAGGDNDGDNVKDECEGVELRERLRLALVMLELIDRYVPYGMGCTIPGI